MLSYARVGPSRGPNARNCYARGRIARGLMPYSTEPTNCDFRFVAPSFSRMQSTLEDTCGPTEEASKKFGSKSLNKKQNNPRPGRDTCRSKAMNTWHHASIGSEQACRRSGPESRPLSRVWCVWCDVWSICSVRHRAASSERGLERT
jgi:hypothetical protein